MYTIQTNQSGTRSMQISDDHLTTIRKYGLFNNLTDSNGFVDENVLENHDNMKAFGLQKLMALYTTWNAEHPEVEAPAENSEV